MKKSKVVLKQDVPIIEKSKTNIVNWDELNSLISNHRIIAEFKDELSKLHNPSISFKNFFNNFIEGLKNYKNDKKESNIENLFNSLIKAWPCHLFFQNENKDNVPLDKFLFFSHNFFKLIDEQYLEKFLNESFKDLNSKLYTNPINISILLFNAVKSKDGVEHTIFLINMLGKNKQLYNLLKSENIINFYSSYVNGSIEQLVKNSVAVKDKLYELKNFLDKGIVYFDETVNSNELVIQYIIAYQRIDLLFTQGFGYKKNICSDQIQKLLNFLPESDDKKLLLMNIRSNFLDKYNSENFANIKEEQINSKLKDLYNKIQFKIKYSTVENIDEYSFKKDLKELHKKLADETFIPENDLNDVVIDQLISLNLNNNLLKNVHFLINQMSDLHFLAKSYTFKKLNPGFIESIIKMAESNEDETILSSELSKYKKDYLYSLEHMLKTYNKNHDVKYICQYIKRGYKLQQIENNLENLNSVIHQNENSRNNDKSSLIAKVNECEKAQGIRKLKTKTKGIADPNRGEQEEVNESKKHKASWIINNEIITTNNKEVIKTKNEGYYVYIDSSINFNKGQLGQFQKAAERGFIPLKSLEKNGLKNKDNEIIKLKINEGNRLITKTIYINGDDEKLIFFSEPPIKHEKSNKITKQPKAESKMLQEYYVHNAHKWLIDWLSENGLSLTDIEKHASKLNVSRDDNSHHNTNNNNLNYINSEQQIEATGEMTHHNDNT